MSALPLGSIPAWAADLYPVVAVVALVVYGMLVSDRVCLGVAVVAGGFWSLKAGIVAYVRMRAFIPGIGVILLSLAAFAVAFAVSVAKSGRLRRWFGDGESRPAVLSRAAGTDEDLDS